MKKLIMIFIVSLVFCGSILLFTNAKVISPKYPVIKWTFHGLVGGAYEGRFNVFTFDFEGFRYTVASGKDVGIVVLVKQRK